MKTFLTLILTVFATGYGVAQQFYGQEFTGDSRIDTVLMLHKMQNQKFPYIEGYRIQIYKETGNNALDSAWSAKNRFENEYQGVKAYISFREPYYRVRVGDFRTRLQAIKFLSIIRKKYPYAWEIKDKIRVDNNDGEQEKNEPPNTSQP
jgi:hypothetical protein